MHSATHLHQPFFFFTLLAINVFCGLHLQGHCLHNPSHAFTGLGQLLVWEWQSESYVLKQQGHFNSMVSLAYSPDGQYIVTGGEDGKVSGAVLLKYDLKS